MDEKDFKKHLKDLADGHHHPEEHDWADATPQAAKKPARAAAAKPAARKSTRRSK